MIELTDIHKNFGTVEVLKGISLQVPERVVTTIVGPSGAGKTTLLQILGTLDRADSGRVVYDGTDVSAMSDKRLSAFRNVNIGFVFQTHRLLPEFTLVENVMMPALIAGQNQRTARNRAEELLGRLGLSERLTHKPAALSGGEAQRGAVARALVNNPRVVLADEPSGSLDSANRRDLHKLFFDLCKDFGTTFVIVTHDEGLAADSHCIVRIDDGRISNITRRESTAV